MTKTPRTLTPSLLDALKSDVATARATYGVESLADAIRAYARTLGMGAPELSAAIGAWPVCADD